MALHLPTDEDTNLFFDDVVSMLESDLGYAHSEACRFAFDYYIKFTDDEFCKK